MTRTPKAWETAASRLRRDPLILPIDGQEWKVRHDVDSFAIISAVLNVSKAFKSMRQLAQPDEIDVAALTDEQLESLSTAMEELDRVQTLLRGYLVDFIAEDQREAFRAKVGDIDVQIGMEVLIAIRDAVSPVDPTQPASSSPGSSDPGTSSTALPPPTE